MSPGQNPAVPPVPVTPANAASAAVPTNPVGRPSPLTVARRRELQQRFERAWSGLRNGSASVDDVHAWIAPCVVEDPASALYVDTLLLNLRRTDGSKKGRWLVRGWHQAQLAAAALRQQWREVLAKGPDVLRGDAAHPPTLWSLVDAAHASGYRESAWRYAEEALRVAPESPETWHRCARTLAARGQFARAAEFWQRITATRAGDAEAQRMLGALHAVTGKKPPPSTDNSQSSPAKPSSSTPGVSTSGASAAGASAAGASADAASVVSASAVGDSPHGDWAVSAAEPATVEACLGRLETLRSVAAWEDAERLLKWAGSRW
ncbi:MAG: tetratricopeptide repeat protein, partial [Planctomycetota bacterium]